MTPDHKRSTPVAMCTRCGAVTRNVSQFNERCHLRFNKKCQGVFRSMVRPDDWKECPSCAATGKGESGLCLSCKGEGWINIRK